MMEESTYYYRLAEWTFLQELYSEIWVTNATANYSIKNYSVCKASGRLDAEYYQPKYEELRIKLKSYKNGCFKLEDITSTFRGNLIPDTLYCDDNVCRAYIRGADISSNILENDKITYIDDRFKRTNEIQCKENDIVFALIGSVGTAARVTEQFEGSYISNNLGLMRLNTNQVKAEYLHLFLTTTIGKMLFEQKEMRTAQPKISDKDILDFPIPKLPMPIQQTISAKIQESFALKAESKRLLDEAKMMVEREIEKE